MRTTQNRRRLAAAVLALTATCTVAACGGTGSDAKDADSAADAAPSIEPGTTLSASEATKVVKAAAESMSTVHVEMEINAVEEGEKIAGTGEGDFQQDPMAFHVKGEIRGADEPSAVEFVILDNTTYASMDGEWVMGGFASVMSAMMPAPNLFLDSVTHAISADTTTYVGQEAIDGVDTAHYTFAAGESDFGAEGSTVDVNVDSEGRLVRMRMNGGDAGEIVFDLSAHGEPVTIAKPSGKITDMSDMEM
ncbi:Protein of unknown function [Nocardioides sp. YR527]|uniref:DUF6612 family protein n=1 Tax=Nocardioides sp. YR527 TaxID=1881028 RepID=UPI0008860D29|nr:DUF6612 family protein [Nocardioides sp. YR527]SDJ70869.1 Protein of unknown function [Nocardioides sp. YR527]